MENSVPPASQGRQALMLGLLQDQRRTSDPGVMMRTAAEAVGRYLGVDRVGFFEMRDEDTVDFSAGWTAGRLELLGGTFPAAGIGTRYLLEVRAGRTLGISDARTDPLTAGSLFGDIGTVSLIGVPIVRGGRWHAGFYVNHSEVRHWSEEEIALVRDVAEQTWDSVERAQAQAALLESEHRFRFLADSIPPIVWTATPDGALDYVNQQGMAYFGVPQEALLGAGWLAMVHPEDQERTVARWNESLATGEVYETSFRLRRGTDGSWRWHLARARALVGESGSIAQWFGICSDIENQKVAEAELTRANRELEEFAYVASHDLQEPLRMVNIYTQLILKHLGNDDSSLNDYAGFVREGITRMEVLIRDLLTFSQLAHRDEGRAGAADLSASLAEALAVLKGRIEETGASITFPALPTVRGDAKPLAHVFQNLLSNALKYRKEGVAPEIVISVEPDDGHWVVAVRDNGIGFESRYSERIFGLFRRLHRDEYPGTGLGLAICQRIVERSGGRIWAEGRHGEGATFYFSLPRVEGQ